METAKIQLRKALPEDLKVDAQTLRFGQPFWLKSAQTGQFDNGPYFLSEETEVLDLSVWLKNEMIYVPVSSLDAKTPDL